MFPSLIIRYDNFCVKGFHHKMLFYQTLNSLFLRLMNSTLPSTIWEENCKRYFFNAFLNRVIDWFIAASSQHWRKFQNTRTNLPSSKRRLQSLTSEISSRLSRRKSSRWMRRRLRRWDNTFNFLILFILTMGGYL